MGPILAAVLTVGLAAPGWAQVLEPRPEAPHAVTPPKPPARRAAPEAAPAAATPVSLTPQPGSPLDRAARALLKLDLEEALSRREVPLVLVGSAKLSARPGDRQALFVQLQSARECGSAGCNTAVYVWNDGVYKRVLDGVSGRLAVAPTRTRGMADLVADTTRYVWNGSEYHDARPAPAIDLRPRAPRT